MSVVDPPTDHFPCGVLVGRREKAIYTGELVPTMMEWSRKFLREAGIDDRYLTLSWVELSGYLLGCSP